MANSFGGAIYCESNSSLALSNSNFTSNFALLQSSGTTAGGALAALSCTISLSYVIFSGNNVTGSSSFGGAIYLFSTPAIISNTIFRINTAAFGGAVSMYLFLF